MSVRQTSLESYSNLKDELKLSRYQTVILECLREEDRPVTDTELIVNHHLPNAMQPRARRNELYHLGLVVECGKRICCISGKKCLTWAASTEWKWREEP